jgi:hypothetical protein
LTSNPITDIGFAKGNNALLHWYDVIRQERENVLISQMVSDVRSRKATFESLYGGVCAIAELRSITKSLENSLSESIEAENHHV